MIDLPQLEQHEPRQRAPGGLADADELPAWRQEFRQWLADGMPDGPLMAWHNEAIRSRAVEFGDDNGHVRDARIRSSLRRRRAKLRLQRELRASTEGDTVDTRGAAPGLDAPRKSRKAEASAATPPGSNVAEVNHIGPFHAHSMESRRVERNRTKG